MKRKYLVSGIVVILAALFFWGVWPTMYSYEHTELGKKRVLVRINRFTHETEALMSAEGWAKLEKNPSLTEIFDNEGFRPQAPMSSVKALQ